MELNGLVWHQETIQLFDTGSGDSDKSKGDNTYRKYHNAFISGPGTYTYEVIVNDNGSTAHVYEVYLYGVFQNRRWPCFNDLSPITYELFAGEINSANQQPARRILDLRVVVKQEKLKSNLSCTSPFMDGHEVASYYVKYAESIEYIADHFEIKARNFDVGIPHPLSTVSDTTFTLDLS